MLLPSRGGPASHRGRVVRLSSMPTEKLAVRARVTATAEGSGRRLRQARMRLSHRARRGHHGRADQRPPVRVNAIEWKLVRNDRPAGSLGFTRPGWPGLS
jgi:hypothetical protein